MKGHPYAQVATGSCLPNTNHLCILFHQTRPCVTAGVFHGSLSSPVVCSGWDVLWRCGCGAEFHKSFYPVQSELGTPEPPLSLVQGSKEEPRDETNASP